MTGHPRERAALTAAAALGPFFAVSPAPGPDWVSWADLCAHPGVLGRRLDEVRTALSRAPGGGAVEPRVAASIAHLGLVARLVAPVLGAALLTGTLPVTAPSRVRIRLSGANPLPLAMSGDEAVVVRSPSDLADSVGRAWLEPAVGPLTAAVRQLVPVSGRVLTGNVTSAVAGALGIAAAARPELAARADATLDALLHAGPLAGTGDRTADGAFVRRSCCLLYRLPGAGTCGDCVLAAPRPEPCPDTG